MISSIKIQRALHIGEVSNSELEALLFDHFQGASEDGTGQVFYPSSGTATKFKLRYHRGEIVEAKAQSALSLEEIKTIGSRVELELLTLGPTIVVRRVLFSHKPLDGYFRYGDRFQILPVPPDAPRAAELMADHPFLLEVAIPSSRNERITQIRAALVMREFELLLNEFFLTLISSGSQGHRKWVMTLPAHRSEYLISGYVYPGLIDSIGYSRTDSIPLLKEIDFETYFGQQHWSIIPPFEIPSHLDELFDRVLALDAGTRHRFLNACSWFQVATLVNGVSRSAAFMALVAAIETLSYSGETKGVTQRFVRFIDHFAPVEGEMEKSRKRFYELRSSLSHGASLLFSDRNPWAVGLNPEMTTEWDHLSTMQMIVRLALVNWLISKDSVVPGSNFIIGGRHTQ